MLCWLLFTGAAAAADIGVASDITPWLLGGYSAVVSVDLDAGWRMTGEVWGMDYPSLLVELTPANQGEGWSRTVTFAGAGYVDYHPSGEGRGLHVGGAVDLLKSRVSRLDDSDTFWSFEALVRVGTRWFPWDEGLFLNPYAAVGPLFALGPPALAAGEPFVESPVQALATVHLGWRFGRDSD